MIIYLDKTPVLIKKQDFNQDGITEGIEHIDDTTNKTPLIPQETSDTKESHTQLFPEYKENKMLFMGNTVPVEDINMFTILALSQLKAMPKGVRDLVHMRLALGVSRARSGRNDVVDLQRQVMENDRTAGMRLKEFATGKTQ